MTTTDSNGRGAGATVDDVARHFAVSTRTVRRWLKARTIPHRRIGTMIRFNLDEVDAWARDSAAERIGEVIPATVWWKS